MFFSTPASLFSLFLLLLISSTQPLHSLASHCPKNQAAALLDMKRSFGGPPSLASWNESEDCCIWRGVMCDSKTGGGVTHLLILSSPDISGPISPSVGRLSSLQALLISNTHVAGSLPPSIGDLTNLTTLVVSNTSLTGTLPNTLCNLRKLRALKLSDNDLVGSIPGCFSKSLVVINLSGNRLSGRIPPGFMSGVTTEFTKPSLLLGGNLLRGPIPQSLGEAPLRFIDLSGNRLSGDAAFLFAENGTLEEMNLAGNKLEFRLSSVEFPLKMQALNLSHNRISGGIPRKISELGMLRILDFSYNRLCGRIPTAGLMKNFNATAFAHNRCLCGGPLKPCGYQELRG